MNWLADKIEQWPTAKLVPYARNARTHSDVIVRRWQEYAGREAIHLATGATFDETAEAASSV